MNKITILQTSDVHGYLYPHDYLNEKVWGLLKLASVIKKYDRDKLLLVDTGDAIQGSPLTYYLNKTNKNQPNPIIDVMNEIGYDVFTFGNHEFNYGLEYLKDSFNNFNGDILSANIKGIDNVLDTKPYEIYEKEGVKIAVIGLTTMFIPNWEEKENIKGLEFLSPVDVYKKYEQKLIKKADVIIVNYHGGLECQIDDPKIATEKLTGENQGSQLLKEFDSIDVLLTGHQHRELCFTYNDTYVVQPANNGQFISEIKIDPCTKQVCSATLIANEKSNPVDLNSMQIIEKYESKVQAYLDQVIGHVDQDMVIDDMFSARLNSHALTNLVNQVQIEVSGADISAVSLFDSAVGFKKDITIRDLIANYPYPNTLKVIEMTASQILRALEVSASYFVVKDGEITVNERFTKPKQQHYQYDLFYGIDYVIDANNPFGEKIIECSIDGKPIDLEKSYNVIVNNYRASNVSWYPMYSEGKLVKEINYDMVELLTNYITKNKEIKISNRKNFKVLK